MKVVFSLLIASAVILLFRPSPAAGHSPQRGVISRNFVTGPGRSIFTPGPIRDRFRSSEVIVITPGSHRFHRHHGFFFHRRHFAGRTIIISQPFFCLQHGVGFINEAGFFDHLHAVDGIAFETIPTVIVQSGPNVIFLAW